MNSSQDGRSPSIIIRLIGTLIGVSLLVYLLSRQGWTEIAAAIHQIPLATIVLACVLMLTSRLAVSARWHALLRSSGAGISLSGATKLTFAGLFAANFLPTTIGGDVVRLAGALRGGQARLDAAASIVVDRLIGMAGMATTAPVGLVKLAGWLLPGTVAGLWMTPSLATVAGTPGTSKAERLVESLRQVPKRIGGLLGMWIRRPGALLAAYCYTWVHMLCLFLLMWLLLRGMGEGISFWLTAGLWSLTYFITLLPLSINGLGIQELSAAFIFSQFGGVSASSSLTLGLLIRTLAMAASLPGAFFLAAILSGARSQEPGGPTDPEVE
ncbi:MAG TPA: lysylphosphatidylglycerol synthase transmembrane domain-containing protein [Anaerolineales bacterium]|nr:lysylphosphatidylglycerol synthase transmembrane domain-containing protein [Anaerolineales bacterium]